MIFYFVKFVATYKGMTTNCFFTPLFCCCFWIVDPGSGMGKNQDPGSGINIPDPQHWRGVKVSLGMGLPMLHKMAIQRRKVSFPSSLSLSYLLFWKLSDSAQPIGEIFPIALHPFPFEVGLDS
jgi:hypothetical protein